MSGRRNGVLLARTSAISASVVLTYRLVFREGWMRRREFIAGLGGAAIAPPLSVLAEQGKVAKIGVLLLGYPDPSLFIKGFGRVCATLDTRRDEASR
jgi:hypothetical protein